MDALTALSTVVRLLATEQSNAAAVQQALRIAELAVDGAAAAELSAAVDALRGELSWRRPRARGKRENFRRDDAAPPAANAARPVVLPGTRVSVSAVPVSRAEIHTAPDGLYWLPENILAARLSGVTLIGNFCVVGRGRATECCAPQCERDLIGCPKYHDPLRYPASTDARALPLPRNLRRAAIPWMPSRERVEKTLTTATPESVAVLEAAAMHALILAVAAKNELAFAGPEQ